MKRIYIAGPMTGLPELNFPAFHTAAVALRTLGHDAVNPAEINADPNAEWLACMRADLAQLVTCDAVYMLPGWEDSRGAKLEHDVACGLGLRRIYAVGDGTMPEQHPVNPRKAFFELYDKKAREWVKTEGWRMVCGAVLHRTKFRGSKFHSQYDDAWTVSDPVSGLAISRGWSMAEAVERYRKWLRFYGEKWQQCLRERRDVATREWGKLDGEG